MTSDRNPAPASLTKEERDEIYMAFHHFLHGRTMATDNLVTAIPRLLDATDALEGENTRLRAALEDFKQFGLRHDLNPTNGHTWDYLRWQGYMQNADSHVRARAQLALHPSA
jgi:hypothetical protein